jgi:antitoxin HigA-1
MTEYAAKRNPDRCPTHPGELLRFDVLPAVGMGKAEIADALGISRQHLHDILTEKKPVSVDIAARLGKAFGNGSGIWLKMQAAYDAWHADRRGDLKVKKLTAA